jgi:hypothetical protein
MLDPPLHESFVRYTNPPPLARKLVVNKQRGEGGRLSEVVETNYYIIALVD